MSHPVKMKAKLPAEETFNGLDYALAAEMVRNPHRQFVVVAYVSVAQVVRDLYGANVEESTYHETPVIQVDAIECLGDVFDVPPAVAAAFRARHARRTDEESLPGISESLHEAFRSATHDETDDDETDDDDETEDVDEETGEILRGLEEFRRRPSAPEDGDK